VVYIINKVHYYKRHVKPSTFQEIIAKCPVSQLLYFFKTHIGYSVIYIYTNLLTSTTTLRLFK